MKASERINRRIELEEISVHLLLDGRCVDVPVTVVLELSPRPQMVLEFSSDDVAAMKEIHEKGDVNVRLEDGRVVHTEVGNRRLLSGGKLSNVLFPRDPLVTVLEEEAVMARSKFVLINFPSIFGKQDIIRRIRKGTRTAQYITQHIQLRAHPWLVEITEVDSLMAIDYYLKRYGGSAITHAVNVTRVDGCGFSLDDLQPLLDALHLFFSFVRGSYCGMTLLSAQDSNRKRVWQQWGTYHVEPWQRELQSWVDGLHSENLSPVFGGLWGQLTDPKQGDAVTKVIHWYLRSNASREPEVSVVLTQAALERLAFSTIGARPSGKAEGNWIAEALHEMDIDHNIPESCVELTGLQKAGEWDHGPHALVRIRNELVHPRRRLGPLSLATQLEAQSLGLHYLELMLLNLTGYGGKYLNRLKRGYSNQLEYVPWVSGW